MQALHALLLNPLLRFIHANTLNHACFIHILLSGKSTVIITGISIINIIFSNRK